MKKMTSKITLITCLLIAPMLPLFAAKITPGPKGGRLLENESPRAEFFIEKDRSITITFYDNDLKPIPVSDQIVNIIAEPKTGKIKIPFEKKGDVLVSKSPLPEGEDYNLIVQIQGSSQAKPQNFRILLNQKPCAKCHRPEYACICDE